MSSKKAMSKQEDSKNEKQLAFVSKADGVDRSENLEALKKGGWLRAQLDKKRTLKDKKKWLESMGILLLEASATHKTPEAVAEQREKELRTAFSIFKKADKLDVWESGSSCDAYYAWYENMEGACDFARGLLSLSDKEGKLDVFNREHWDRFERACADPEILAADMESTSAKGDCHHTLTRRTNATHENNTQTHVLTSGVRPCGE